jgi:DNA-binding IclR family transcriptional regulator
MSQTLRSVAYALRLIKLLRTRADVGVTDAATHLGVAASTAHRLLATLQEHGFAEQTRTGRRYRLGSAMTTSSEAQAIEHCIEVGRPFMEQLRDESLETVHIAVLTGSRVDFVVAVESPRQVRVSSRVGLSIPAHSSAAGKVLLAELSDEEIDELYPVEQLTGETEVGIHTRTALKRELERVRAAGYGRNIGESEDGLAALAVPVTRPGARTLCSLTLTGPVFRFDPGAADDVSSRENELRAMLAKYAAQISKCLAY